MCRILATLVNKKSNGLILAAPISPGLFVPPLRSHLDGKASMVSTHTPTHSLSLAPPPSLSTRLVRGRTQISKTRISSRLGFGLSEDSDNRAMLTVTVTTTSETDSDGLGWTRMDSDGLGWTRIENRAGRW